MWLGAARRRRRAWQPIAGGDHERVARLPVPYRSTMVSRFPSRREGGEGVRTWWTRLQMGAADQLLGGCRPRVRRRVFARECRPHRASAPDQLAQRGWVDRLVAIRERLIRPWMHLDEQPIGACRDRRDA